MFDDEGSTGSFVTVDMHEHGNLFSYPQFNSTQITDPVVTGGSITKSAEINGGVT